ncbi:hypothetical protein [Flagellimonas olearia]|uniref:Adenylosuccinate lyase n=1 Tax=Flagellimonas olearia TaxID=552546 RepID=A0A444VQJ9_9FLAO|nr:hypothetical protein [Allomuricauda olearia]RYC52962.1 hypothetical protein DN53_01700 [Allomuricauda olearia]
MTKQQLHIQLHSGRLSKVHIDQLVEQLVKQPSLTESLFLEVLQEDKIGTFNASWTFDHLMRKRLVYLLPMMTLFTNSLSELQCESCIRSMAHVCEMITKAYFKKTDPVFIKNIADEHLEKIMISCFDWLISPMNMAPKVFSMTSLYYLGLKFDWVHPELRVILEDSYASGTIGYQNRAKKTLDKLAKLSQ